jgi:NADH-quinone oxidoreductase subunit M
VLLGLMTLNTVGLSGSVLQMFSHGIIAGLLFAVVGRMVYDRTHTRQLAELEPLGLSRVMPFAAVTFVVAGAASIGLPGFSGFIAELQVLMGAWSSYPTLTVLAGVGILIGVAFTWRAMQKAFFGDTPAEDSPHADSDAPSQTQALDPISIPERLGAAILIGASLAVGLYPHLLLRVIVPSFNSPLFEWLKRGGGQ